MRVHGITDIGKARSINQDSYAVEMLEDAETGILLVCDGMGGSKGRRNCKLYSCQNHYGFSENQNQA